MKTLRVGVAGLGFGASVHLPGLQSLPGVQVVALAGRHVDKAREIAARYGVKTVAGSWQELLEQPLDAVTFALPPLENERACQSALERGMSVLSEKPLAGSVAAAEQLSALARGVPCAIDFEFAELEGFRRLRSLISSRALGAVRHVQITWLIESLTQKTKQWSWKTDSSQRGGVTTLLGSHLLYLLEWIFGEIRSVESRQSSDATARFAPLGAKPADDRVDLWITLSSGTTVTATYGNSAPGGPGHRWDCICDGGTISLSNRTQDYMIGFELTTRTSTGQRSEYQDEPVEGVDGRLPPFCALAQRFVDAVRTRGNVQPDFVAGARVQRLMEQVLNAR